MTRSRIGCVLMAGLIALVLAACGPNGTGDSPDPAPDPGEVAITVVATEFTLDPADIEVPADTPVVLTLDNQGVVEHDFTIDELGIEIYAGAGEMVTETIAFPTGTYHVYCSIPGHHESGMMATLTAG